MANKEFKIQSDTVSLNGVPLTSSIDGKVVIPGVTRSTGYIVEEVNDTGDQTYQFQNPSTARVVDYSRWMGNEAAATYSISFDDDGYIDEINVEDQGTYTVEQFNTSYSFGMYAYDGTDPNPTVGLPQEAWFSIPFKPKFKSSGIESEFGSGGNANTGTITFDGNTISSEEGYPTLVNAPGSGGGVEIDYDSDAVSHAMWLNGEDGLAIQINRHLNEGQTNWRFGPDGALTFPDGTKQYTAGGAGNASSYQTVFANVDGTVITSVDGVNWEAPVPSGMTAINRIEVGNGIIVYIGEGTGGNPQGIWYSTVIGTVTQAVGTDSLEGSNVNWRQVRYITETSTWVALGSVHIDQFSADFPLLAYSTDGINWSMVPVDVPWADGFTGGGVNWTYTDVVYDTRGQRYVVAGKTGAIGSFSGVWLTNDLSVPLNGSTHIPAEVNTEQLMYMPNIFFNGSNPILLAVDNTDEHPSNGTMWANSGDFTNPTDYSYSPEWLQDTFRNNVGYVPTVSETAFTSNSFIITTVSGQVWYQPNAPFTGVNVPLPYTAPVVSVDLTDNNLTIGVDTSTNGPASVGEKITISGSTESNYNNSFYLGPELSQDGSIRYYKLYTWYDLGTPVDTTGWNGSSGALTLTYSHGQYIDSAGAANGILYVGNDDEQIFRSTDSGGSWTQVADFDGEFLNDFAYGLVGGSIASNKLRAGSKEFKLNTDGSITLPLKAMTGYRENYTLNGPTLQLGDSPTGEVVVTGPAPTVNSISSTRLIIQGQQGFGGENNNKGEGGDIYLWAGTGGTAGAMSSQGDGGDIKVRGGQGGYGGYVKVEGGDATATGAAAGRVEITGGNNSNTGGVGGDVQIAAGYGSGSSGEIRLSTTTDGGGQTNYWYFKKDGNLQLPQGATIVNSIGDPILGTAEELIGGGYVPATGIKRVVNSSATGFQGGEANSVFVKTSQADGISQGDTITFRNGEVRTINSTTNDGDNTWLYWAEDVVGDDFNPRYPITLTTANYTAEIKKTARLVPDFDTAGSGQFMDVYVGGSMVVDNKHVHMAGHTADTEVFLGTDNNFVSAKEKGSGPARVNLKSENDITVSDSNLRMSRGKTAVTVYGDGQNRNNWGNTADLAFSVGVADDQGNYYIGGEHCNNADAMISKYGPDGDLIWTRVNDNDFTWAGGSDGVAYNPVDKEVAMAVRTGYNKNNNYYKITKFDAETGDLKSTDDVFDNDGGMYARAMTWHPTLGYVLVGATSGELDQTGSLSSSYPSSYNTTTLVTSSGNELLVNRVSGQGAPCIGENFDYDGSNYTITSVNVYPAYYGLVVNGATFTDSGSNPVTVNRTRGIIEFPNRNSTKLNNSFPMPYFNWYLTGNNINGRQYLQNGVGVYQNVPVIATSGSGTGMTISMRSNYNSGTWEYFSQHTTGTNYNNGDTFKIPGSFLGGVDTGATLEHIPAIGVTAENPSKVLFDGVAHPHLDKDFPANRSTLTREGTTYNILSYTWDAGNNWWMVEIDSVVSLNASSWTFTVVSGDDITGTVSDNANINNGYTGVPSPNAPIRLDMTWDMGYSGTDFAGGTYVLQIPKNERAFVWTSGWTKYLDPQNSGDQTRAYDVAVDSYSGGIVVSGYEGTQQVGFLWKLDVDGNTSWAIGWDEGDLWSVAVSPMNGNIYATTNNGSLIKFNSFGTPLARVYQNGAWNMSTAVVRLEQELDGDEYVYVGARLNWANWINNSGFIVSKLNSNLDLIWSRDIWHSNNNINQHYDTYRPNMILGRDSIVFLGYGQFMKTNGYYQNALMVSFTKDNTFETFEQEGWHIENIGTLAGWFNFYSDYSNNLISSGTTIRNSTIQTETSTANLQWLLWQYINQIIDLNLDHKGIVGVEGIKFVDGGLLDHNPSDIPRSPTDFYNNGWNYTLQLRDRGRFIINQPEPNNSNVANNDLYITVPSNNTVPFPVGTVITLINSSHPNYSGYWIYVQPENWNASNSPKIWATGFQDSSTWAFQGIQTATLMKIGSNEWLLTANNISDQS